jgi:hypothetical protein
MLRTFSLALLLITMGSSYSYAASPAAEIEQRFMRESVEKTKAYADRLKRPFPEVKDYKYGMKLDVDKIIYSGLAPTKPDTNSPLN